MDGESEYVEVDKTDYYDLKGKSYFRKWIQQIAKWCWNHPKKYKNRAEQENFQMKTKAKYVIVILFLCTIPLYFCRMIGWKDDAIRLYDVILYGMESQEGDSFVGGMIWKLMQESVFENINAWLIGTAAVTLVGSVLVTLLNGKRPMFWQLYYPS